MNICGRGAAGTLISRRRDMAGALMTSIVLKRGVTLLDIVSTRMLGQYGFMARYSARSTHNPAIL
jgi:hypothetical protein